ncbi:hypothetical protein EAS61_29100 [Bradyrhizobium zhanjiangense]|uniref:Serine protease n=2 Tax=Bradyrhizobium zhanjiangense TaxID=1325107 RepID=A0A4Q0QDN3_9BRAD|nr:hypothetical protein EAS61_29100 [Bradyrhizobium zhanjiangense]
MPRVPQELLDASFYLYPSAEAAKAGGQAGGTGFFVSVPHPTIEGTIFVYAVSNSHVVHADGCSVIRVNTILGGTDVIELDPAQWHAKHGNDLAVCLVQLNPAVHKCKCVDESWFVTKDGATSGVLGVGDDVFMVGRFMNHDGHLTNVPSARFGHLSMLPLDIHHPAGYRQESFAVEMLSRPGYSGSPVYLFRVPYDLATGNLSVGGRTMWLLGVNWGFITDTAEVKEEGLPIVPAGLVEDEKQKSVRYVKVNTGMNGVVPAWRLRKLLSTGRVKLERDAIIARDAAHRVPPSGLAETASAVPANKR